MTDSTFAKLAMSMPRGSRVASLVLCGALLSACAIGPDYQRPAVIEPVQFKEAQGWRQATPSDSLARGAWWELYGDRQLNELVTRLNNANQTVAQAEARFRQAQAQVRSARGAFFPSVDLSVGKTRASQGTGSSSASLSSSSSGIRDTLNAQLGVSWEADVWGKLRRGLEANEATAEASSADLAAMRLSQQSELVQSYLKLRVMDEQTRLLQATLDAYQRSLQMTENQYRAGVSGKDAIAQAQTQLKTTPGQPDRPDLATCPVGKRHRRIDWRGAGQLSIWRSVKTSPALPQIPVSVPSQLLERRPDIASAERSVIAANANIGVAKAAYYPDLTLSLRGYSSSTYANWISLPNRFWSVGPKLR